MSAFTRYILGWCVLVCALFAGIFASLTAAPGTFPENSIVVVSEGETTAEIAVQLAAADVIAQPLMLQAILKVSGNSARVHAGAYLFKTQQNVFTIARRLAAGEYGMPMAKLTFPEGITVREMGKLLVEELPLVSTQAFIAAAKQHEGYLFPDTYYFSPSATTEEVIKTLRNNFDTKTVSLADDAAASGHSVADIITMASILEKEARTEVNRRLVAGVLYNRLNKNMPLQVDAVFGYIFNRDTYSPSATDLRVDSPYNTYTHRGLPPGPINNPGLAAIEDALHPTSNNYLYYLTDHDGLMHYARTYPEHQANQKKYLK